ncbi:MAG: hypothetical protein MZW92_36320 [Comamonadaceae bacterium]|nr:hypothetical protein [Comamonadaceae bacterium]
MEGLEREFPDNANVVGKSGVKLTPRMTASVAGLGFDITALGESTQLVSATEPTTWLWQAKAGLPASNVDLYPLRCLESGRF